MSKHIVRTQTLSVAIVTLILCAASTQAQTLRTAPIRDLNNPAINNNIGRAGGLFNHGYDMGAHRNSMYTPWTPYASYPDPYGGYLQGASSVIEAQGQFMKDNQQAMLMKEQTKQAKLDTKRKSFDEWLYERDNTPTLEDNRQRAYNEELRRSRNDPPVTEIWSGKTLNDMLGDIQKNRTSAGPEIPLTDDMLKHINVTTGANEGNVGLLKDGGKLEWTLALYDKAFDKDRTQLDKNFPEAVKQAQGGKVAPVLIREMTDAVNRMLKTLKGQVNSLGPQDYIEAKRYLNDVEKAITGLRDPSVSNYFNKKWSAQGHNVSELVSYMTSNGLKFAPAVPGDEASYTALHNALVAYDASVSRLVAR